MSILRYQQYRWVYILGAGVTFVNALFLHNALLSTVSLVVLYGILFYKGIHILRCYRQTNRQHASMDKAVFTKTYRVFRVRVALFWLAFIALCVTGKFIFHMARGYFYCCTFFFLFLDRWFVNVICLLQKLSDPRGTVVLCCCGCPCRGWDLMMIHTPLLFALEHQNMLENALILLSSALAVASFFCWETHKYHLVEVRKKCPVACDLQLCKEHHPG